jgi:hypothetical protein
MFCDEHNIAAIKRQHKSIAIAGGFMLSEDFWPAVLNDPDQQ